VTITAPPPGVEADGPVVVLVHGGAWVAGSPDLLDNLATALAADGAVVFNASYRLARQPGGGDPGSLDDVACAIRFARAEAPAYTDADELVLVGHSAGAHLAAVVALDPTPWGGDCSAPPAEPPDRFVGLAGIYDVKAVPVVYLFATFVGASTTEAPERWTAVNPVELAERQDLDVVLVTGSEDELVSPAQAQTFADALPDGAEIVEIAGADHNDLQYPSIVGPDTILEN
jgi:acetyl esterase/lipase